MIKSILREMQMVCKEQKLLNIFSLPIEKMSVIPFDPLSGIMWLILPWIQNQRI